MSQGSDQRRDSSLPRDQRRARGVYYTPAAVVKYIVGETLKANLWQPEPLRVLDPACGDGAFLSEVAARLVEHGKIDLLEHTLFGIDRDEIAVYAARRNVARQVLGDTAKERQISALARRLAGNIVVGDALLAPLPQAWPSEFDAIMGNPPYVNIRRLASDVELVARYRERFRCARRGFDLYVLFIERALELLRAGGRCGFIVPNKLATLEYAAECRTMLVAETRLETLADFSEIGVFSAASVYPHVIVFEKGSPPARHAIRVVRPKNAHANAIQVTLQATIAQSQLNRRGTFAWDDSYDLEARVATRPLSELCRLHSGTTGFVAQEIAAELQERSEANDGGFPFITSGNIDRYAILPGNVRYMRRRFAEPLLRRDCSLLTAAKRELFASPKIVIAGMSRRLEAAWSVGPLALGVQVFAAAAIEVDPFYLLTVLNSELLSRLFCERFSAKRLGGGFLSVNKGQLAQLPIVDPRAVGRAERCLVTRLSELGRELTQRGPVTSLDNEVDQLVERLYRQSIASVAA